MGKLEEAQILWDAIGTEIEPEANTTTRVRNAATKIIDFITDDRTRVVLGIGVLLIVLFMLVSFVSYFVTGAADQSKMDLSWSEMQQMRTQVQNWASVTGAILAETFINRWFGISSFAILYFGFIIDGRDKQYKGKKRKGSSQNCPRSFIKNRRTCGRKNKVRRSRDQKHHKSCSHQKRTRLGY